VAWQVEAAVVTAVVVWQQSKPVGVLDLRQYVHQHHSFILVVIVVVISAR